MPQPSLRAWQEQALTRWTDAGHRGIVSVVTGGGKTIFALTCIAHIKPETALVVVPTVALLDQWWEETAAFFDFALDEINVVGRRQGIRTGTVNLAVLNTAAKIESMAHVKPLFLIVDECHKAASPEFQNALNIPHFATLGLSATPERQYDDGLHDVLIPALGNIIYDYNYRDAMHDSVIVPFVLRNIVFQLEEERQQEYDRLTKAIARAIRRAGMDAPDTVALFLRRARVQNLSLNRIQLTLRLVAANRGRRILIFHEDTNACDLIHSVLAENGVRSGIYHSKMPLRTRVEMLSAYRNGKIEVLVTCRALDEGFNVPETEIGIIAAATATRRQRIQRLGRVLRPAHGKESAIVYTLVASSPEIGRLQQEEKELEGVANVSWSQA